MNVTENTNSSLIGKAVVHSMHGSRILLFIEKSRFPDSQTYKVSGQHVGCLKAILSTKELHLRFLCSLSFSGAAFSYTGVV